MTMMKNRKSLFSVVLFFSPVPSVFANEISGVEPLVDYLLANQ